MQEKTFKIGNVECPIMEEKVLVSKQGETLDFPHSDVPSGIKYTLSDDQDLDPAKFVLLGVKENFATMLIGPKGTGKTTTAAYVAQELNRPLMYMQMTGATQVDSFVGKWLVKDGATYWVDGILTKAMRFGYILVLDELNMALPEITSVLHGVMDERKILVLDDKGAGEVIQAHEDFRIISAINPSGDYEGTKEMNEALMDRFKIVVQVDYPDARKERNIILSKSSVKIDDANDGTTRGKVSNGIITRMVTAANAIRKGGNTSATIEFQVSTRNLIDLASLLRFLPFGDALNLSILNKIQSNEDKKKIMGQFTTDISLDERWLPESERTGKRAARGSLREELAETATVEF